MDPSAVQILVGTMAGIMQMHAAGVAHNQLSTSHIMIMKDKTVKVASLGRCESLRRRSPHADIPAGGEH